MLDVNLYALNRQNFPCQDLLAVVLLIAVQIGTSGRPIDVSATPGSNTLSVMSSRRVSISIASSIYIL